MKNNTKYNILKTINNITVLSTIACFVAFIIPYLTGNKINYPNEVKIVIGIASALGFVILAIIGKPYKKARELVEYDEFGLKKHKGRYDISTEERNALDLQRMADMERILSKSALKKMIKEGSKDPMHELNELIGLESVKTKVKEMAARMKFDKQNKKKVPGSAVDSGRHMVFYGSPGTGKTTVARIMTGILYKNHYIKENKCIECDGNFLKSGNPDDTATKVKLILKQASGGVLFIDEAYALYDDGYGCGKEAIATLVKEMEDRRGELIIIFAGYHKEMKMLLDSNLGFKSRIKEYIEFPDYDDSALKNILLYMAGQNNFCVSDEYFDKFLIRMYKEKQLNSWANARTVRNVLEESIDSHAYNFQQKKITSENKYRLMECDISSTPTNNF